MLSWAKNGVFHGASTRPKRNIMKMLFLNHVGLMGASLVGGSLEA